MYLGRLEQEKGVFQEVKIAEELDRARLASSGDGRARRSRQNYARSTQTYADVVTCSYVMLTKNNILLFSSLGHTHARMWILGTLACSIYKIILVRFGRGGLCRYTISGSPEPPQYAFALV